jgi:O-antigen/teichoic acid export membrane protein
MSGPLDPVEPEATRDPEGDPPPAAGQPGARRALGWSFANMAIGRLGTLAIGIAIARLLGPTEYGTFAVAMVALIAVLSFNELGVSLAIIRWEGDPARIAGTVTSISVGSSLIVFVAGWFLAPVFATTMGDPSATDVIRLMLVCVPIDGLVATPAALLQRNYQQGRRTIADQVNIWLGAALSLTLVLFGMGAMSLAIGRVVATIVFAILMISFSPLPLRFGWDRTVVGPLMRFGTPLAGASILVFAVGYLDQLVVGWRLGAEALGFYTLALNLANWPVSMLSQPVRAVAPTAFSRIQNDPERMDVNFRASFRLLLAVSLPACAALAGAAAPVIGFVYGEQWATAALALQWLALTASLRIVFELAYDFLVVKRKSLTLAVIQGIWVVVLVPALIIGAEVGGIGGVACAQFVVAGVVVLGCYAFALARGGIRLLPLLRSLLIPLLVAIVVGVAAVVLSQVISVDFFAALAAGVVALVAIAGLGLLSRSSYALLRARQDAA